MTGGGLALPCPVYKYVSMPWASIAGVCTGASGFAVSRHVHITFASNGIRILAFSLKILLYLWYAWYVGLYHKSYLDYGHFDGISRLQIQHPVDHCNPLTKNPAGCLTAFRNVTELPYCTQNPNATVTEHEPHECRYYDEFDAAVKGEIPQKTLFVPTRITTYTQNVACTNSLIPCPETVQLVEKETFFLADIESFTVLVDHSFVSDELNVEMCAWSMLGFINPCGEGSMLDERLFSGARDSLKRKFMSMRVARDKECEGKEAEYIPVIPPKALEEEHESEEKIEIKHKGFAMWMSPGWRTLLGSWMTLDYETVVEELEEDHRESKWTKITNGDFIKISDLLELAGGNLDKPSKENNRFEGLVLILNIEYTNVKENTWPNAIPPAYFYSAWVAPASEYKAMQERDGIKRFRTSDPQVREIVDYHGIYIIVKQGGHIGAFSFAKLAVLLFIFMAIDSIYRSLFLCIVFNSDCCGEYGHRAHLENDEEGNPTWVESEEWLELDEKVTFDFKLYGKASRDESQRALTARSDDSEEEGSLSE